MSQLNIFHYIIFCGTIIGFINYKNLPKLLKSFPFFLLITLFVECSTPLKLIRFGGNNHWLFNIFTTTEFLYYGYLFYHILEKSIRREIIPVIMSLFLVFTLVNIFYIQGSGKFHTISYRVGALIMVVFCFLYFRQLMRSDGYINLLRNPYFWICTGILFFYLGFFFYFSAFDYLVYNKLSVNVTLFSIISDTLNILLYSSLVIAMICPRKNNK